MFAWGPGCTTKAAEDCGPAPLSPTLYLPQHPLDIATKPQQRNRYARLLTPAYAIDGSGPMTRVLPHQAEPAVITHRQAPCLASL